MKEEILKSNIRRKNIGKVLSTLQVFYFGKIKKLCIKCVLYVMTAWMQKPTFVHMHSHAYVRTACGKHKQAFHENKWPLPEL